MSTTVPEAATSRKVVPVERPPAMVTLTSTRKDRERGSGVDIEIEIELEDLIDIDEIGKGKIPGAKEIVEAMMDLLDDFFDDADDDDVGGGGSGGGGDGGGGGGSDDDTVDVDAPVYGDITVTCSCG